MGQAVCGQGLKFHHKTALPGPMIDELSQAQSFGMSNQNRQCANFHN